jgi:hypothetical protein
MANLNEPISNKNNKNSHKSKNYAYFEKEFQEALDVIKDVNSDIYFEQKLGILGKKILCKDNYSSHHRASSKLNKIKSSEDGVKKIGEINWLQILEVCAMGLILYLLTYFK